MQNNTQLDTQKHTDEPEQYCSVLRYPKTRDGARGEIFRQGMNLRIWAKKHDISYQAVRDVLSRDINPVAGERLRAAIALGLVPENPDQFGSLDPNDRNLHVASLCVAKLKTLDVSIIEVTHNAFPSPLIKILPHAVTDSLFCYEMWSFENGGTRWSEKRALFMDCLLVWIEESRIAMAAQP